MTGVDEFGAIGKKIDEGKLSPRLVLEDFLLVRLGVRRAALVTVPAELPDGPVLGAQVDYEFRDRLAGKGSDMRTRLADTIERRKRDAVAFKTFLLQSSFANQVLGSPSYTAHRALAKGLDLEVQESGVRPTIREWYISVPSDRLEIADLLWNRRKIQAAVRPAHQAGAPVLYYVYPEERDAAHVRRLGGLLGYPECCVEAYVRGREAGDGLGEDQPERRARRQLAQGNHADPLAYFAQGFLPCRPDCPAAAAKGKEARAALAKAGAGFGEAYDRLKNENVARVRAGG